MARAVGQGIFMFEFFENITTQKAFLAPGKFIYWFLLSLFELESLGYSVDLIVTAIIAIVFWAHVMKAIGAVIRRITGFEQGQ